MSVMPQIMLAGTAIIRNVNRNCEIYFFIIAKGFIVSNLLLVKLWL